VHFTSNVFKCVLTVSLIYSLQNEQEAELTADEKKACRRTLEKAQEKPKPAENSTEKPAKEPLRKRLKMMVKKKLEERKKASSRRSRYNSGIRGAILASAACVEQFWSEANAVLTKRRSAVEAFPGMQEFVGFVWGVEGLILLVGILLIPTYKVYIRVNPYGVDLSWINPDDPG